MLDATPLGPPWDAILVGAVATALLWRLRGARSGRHAIASTWLAVLATVVLAGARALAPEAAVSQGAPGPPAPGGTGEVVVKLILTVAIMLWVNAGVQVFDLVVWDVALVRWKKAPVISRLVIDVFNVVVLLVAGLVVVNQVFLQDLTTLLVTSTVVSAVIGLALQDVLRNVVAGLALQIESPFSLGEWVRVGSHEGQVMQMNWRTVTLRTRENVHVVVNNVKIATDDVVNLARPAPPAAIDAFVGVAYPHPPGEVKAVLSAAVAGTPGVLAAPAPRVYTDAYGDFAVGYRIRFWIADHAALLEIQDAVMTRVWYGLRRAGMGIPFPIRDVNLRLVPKAHAREMVDERHRLVLDTLRPVPLLAPLRRDELERVAAGAEIHRFTAGELLVRQGDAGESLFVVRSGRVRVEVTDGAGRAVTVTTRGAGEVLGEMSLLTGAPRSASLVAEGEAEVVVVHRAAFADVLMADPAIAERISDLLATRSGELEALLAESGAQARSGEKRLRDELLGRIRGFFGLGEG